MSKTSILFPLLFIVLFKFNGICQSLYNGVGHIPENCRINWTHAGLYNKISYADHIINIKDFSGTDDENIVNAMNAAPSTGITIIYYPIGTYTFYNTIKLKNNIVIQGEDQSATIFEFTIDKCNNCIEISGNSPTNEVKIISDILKNDVTINVADLTGYENYPWVQYYEKRNPIG